MSDERTRVRRMLDLAIDMLGHPYKWGGKSSAYHRALGRQEPLDCSGFVNYATCAEAGGGLLLIERDGRTMPAVDWHGAFRIYEWCRPVSVAGALANRGCFLFMRKASGNICHVAVSLGAGHTIEAVGGAIKGVTVFRPSENAKRYRDGVGLGGKLDCLFRAEVNGCAPGS